MTTYGVSSAGVQTLGAAFQLDVARWAEELGYSAHWIAEANATEGFAVLGATAVVAPTLGLGTGVLALQLRTPPLAAMAAATLQSLAPDRDVFLGIGISSPVVVGHWHGADYGDRPIARVREYVALVRECLSGETVTFDGDFWSVKKFRLGVRLGERRPKIVVGALNPQMLRTAGEIADGVLLNYLPSSHVPWSVEQIRQGGDATVYAYVHTAVTDRDRWADAARKDLFSYAIVPAYGDNFARAGFADDIAAMRAAHAARDREATLAAIGDDFLDAIQILGDADHVQRSVQAYADNGVDVPIVFPCPWGEDRRATVRATLEAVRPRA